MSLSIKYDYLFKLKSSSFIILLVCIFNCINIKSKINENLISYSQDLNEEVIFSELSKNIINSNLINHNWSYFNSKKSIPYYRLKNNSGTVIGNYFLDGNKFLVIKLKNGNYIKWKYGFDENLLPNHLAKISDYNNAKSYIGKYIWLNELGNDSVFLNYSTHSFQKFEKTIVTGVKIFQNSLLDSPIWLEINTKDKHSAFIRYNGEIKTVSKQNYYYDKYPFKKKWPKIIRDKIMKGTIDYGMSHEQVRLSIGNPSIINNTSSRHGVSQQWIYGVNINTKRYLSFENGVLVSM